MENIVFDSVSQYTHIVKGLDIAATQTSNGRFHGQQRSLTMSKLTISTRSFNTSLSIQARVKKDEFTFLLPRDSTRMYANCVEVNPHKIYMCSSEQEIFFNVRSEYQSIQICISTSNLLQYINIDELVKLTSLLQNNTIELPHHYQYKQQLYAFIENLLLHHERYNEQALFDAEEYILNALRTLLSPALNGQLKITESYSTRKAIIKRALDYIHKDQKLQITIPELASVCFCSIRSLEYAFRAILQLSPKKYLILRRFQLIREILMSSTNIQVNEILDQFGIINHGRFANDYFRFFGEYPSQSKGSALERYPSTTLTN